MKFDIQTICLSGTGATFCCFVTLVFSSTVCLQQQKSLHFSKVPPYKYSAIFLGNFQYMWMWVAMGLFYQMIKKKLALWEYFNNGENKWMLPQCSYWECVCVYVYCLIFHFAAAHTYPKFGVSTPPPPPPGINTTKI